MKTRPLLAILSAVALASSSADAQLLSENFGTGYVDGNLAGQNGWTAINASGTNPIQISSGAAVLNNTGEDDAKAFASSYTTTAGTSLNVTISLSLSAAQTGDYFLTLGTTSGGGTFFGKISAKSSASGYLLGVSGSSSTGTYGTTVLDFGSIYTVSMVLDFVTGTSNDVASLFVGGSPYASATNTGGTDPSTLASAILRQGASGAVPTVSITSISVTAVPEPQHYALAVAGMLFVVAAVRRRAARD